ncbi:nucleoid-associated protein [Methylobacter svalbardensis]|uniref:nucleoid-associated protein n=1 Tax=Methylobacter svalbardensis TaxID=3080016 RepID=UPI0030EEF86B
MIDISSAEVTKAIVHRVGNRIREEGYSLSTQEIKRTKDIDDILLRHYLSPLVKRNEIYDFYHESDIGLNTIYHFTKQVFANPSIFSEQSRNIAKHLYSASTHPKISSGELIIILFTGLVVDGTKCDALGIYRIETKDSYLDINDDAGAFQLIERTGISLEKMQKGALVLSSNYRVFAVDTLSQKTKYWMESFLKITPQSTPKVCAKVGGELLKAISSKISDPNSALELGNRISKSIEDSETISLGVIKKISSDYVEQDSLNEILSNLQVKSGFDLADELTLDSPAFAKYTKSLTKHTRIADGITLVMSNTSANISKIDIQKTQSGLFATIAIEIMED